MSKYAGTLYEDLDNIEEFEPSRKCAGCGQFTEESELTWDEEDEVEYCDECNGK